MTISNSVAPLSIASRALEDLGAGGRGPLRETDHRPNPRAVPDNALGKRHVARIHVDRRESIFQHLFTEPPDIAALAVGSQNRVVLHFGELFLRKHHLRLRKETRHRVPQAGPPHLTEWSQCIRHTPCAGEPTAHGVCRIHILHANSLPGQNTRLYGDCQSAIARYTEPAAGSILLRNGSDLLNQGKQPCST